MIVDALEGAKYLSFNIDSNVFAIDISRVREILDITTITKVPRTPEFMLGVLNLRGGVVPVIDLRRKFDMGSTEITIHTCVIIIETSLEGETVVIGAMADSVDEVFNLENEDIEPAPKIGTAMDTRFLKGVGKKDNEFVLILDMDRVLSDREKEIMQSSGDEGAAGAE